MGKRTSILVGLAACGAAFALFAASGAPQSVDLQRLRNLGQATYEEQRYVDAAAAFTEILLDAAATPQDRLNLAVAQYANGDEQAALQTLDDAADLLDDHPGAQLQPANPGERLGVKVFPIIDFGFCHHHVAALLGGPWL